MSRWHIIPNINPWDPFSIWPFYGKCMDMLCLKIYFIQQIFRIIQEKMDKSAKLTPLKMFFWVNTGICQPAFLVYWRVHGFFAAPHGNRCPLRLVSCPRTPTCVITKTATAVPMTLRWRGTCWGIVTTQCGDYPGDSLPQNMSVCIKVGGSESVNQWIRRAWILNLVLVYFFWGGMMYCVWLELLFWNHKYNCEVNLWGGAFWREHAHIEKQRFGMVRGWTVLLTPGLAV